MSTTKQRGFSLIELVLVIAIIMVLSLVSGPLYRNHANKSRQTEGYALLGTIRSAQEKYFGEFGTFYYPGDNPGGYSPTGYDPVLGIDARMNKFYKTFKSFAWVGKGDDTNTNKDYSDWGKRAWLFHAEAYGTSGAADLVMVYNRTVGVEIFIKGDASYNTLHY